MSQQVSKVSYSLVPSFEGNAREKFGYLLFVIPVNSDESVPCSVLVCPTFKCGSAQKLWFLSMEQKAQRVNPNKYHLNFKLLMH